MDPSPTARLSVVRSLAAAGALAAIAAGCKRQGDADLVSTRLAALRLVNPSEALVPPFDPATTEYTASVGPFATSVRILAVTESSSATLRVQESGEVSGIASEPIPLAPGPNVVAVVVKGRGGTSQTYEITVTRAAELRPSPVFFKASNPGNGDLFGFSVAVSGDTMAVGTPLEDTTAQDSGAVYVFERREGVWSQTALLKASNAEAGDQFGQSVAIDDETIVVGSLYEDSGSSGVDGDQTNDGLSNSGAAYVFVRTGGVWTQQAYLKASNPGIDDVFGDLGSVGVSGDVVVIGAPGEDSGLPAANPSAQSDNSAAEAGAAYVFVRNGTAWLQQAYLKAPDPDAGDHFGFGVAVSGETTLVGAWGEDSGTIGVNSAANETAPESGAAFVFVRSGTAWIQEAYLKPSNTGGSDQFGVSVDLSGNTAIVGSYFEDSSATGVNGDQGDSSPTNSGAAYVFVRTGTTWIQQAYLKASNTGVEDYFAEVSISGDAAVVGSYAEDSNATGLDGNQANDLSLDSGAAYLFLRTDGSWSQHAYLKASNTGAGDWFGLPATVSGDVVAIGAFLEDSEGTGVDPLDTGDGAPDSGAAYLYR